MRKADDILIYLQTLMIMVVHPLILLGENYITDKYQKNV